MPPLPPPKKPEAYTCPFCGERACYHCYDCGCSLDMEEHKDDCPEKEMADLIASGVCIACRGSGKATSGRVCFPCDGTGLNKQRQKANESTRSSETGGLFD